MKKFLKSLYFRERIYFVIGGEVAVLVLGFFFPLCFAIGKYALAAIVVLLLADITLLYRNKRGVHARRNTMDKLSNGDENDIQIVLGSDAFQ